MTSCLQTHVNKAARAVRNTSGRILQNVLHISLDPEFYILLQISEEKLVIIKMIGAFGQDGKNWRIFLRRDICDFEDAPFRIDIASSQIEQFSFHPAIVVGKAGICI